MKILGILVFLLIVGLAVALKAGWRPSMPRMPRRKTKPAAGKRTEEEPIPKKERLVGALFTTVGVVGGLGLLLVVFWIAKPIATRVQQGWEASSKAPTTTTRPIMVVAFPTSGSGEATKDEPIRAYLDPKRTHTRPFPLGKAKYVFANNPELVFNDSGPNPQVWDKMPAGNYLIYPRNAEKVEFSWWID